MKLSRKLVSSFLVILLVFSLPILSPPTEAASSVDVCNCVGSTVYGGPCYAGYGGPAYAGYGGAAYAGYGGPCYAGYGGPKYNSNTNTNTDLNRRSTFSVDYDWDWDAFNDQYFRLQWRCRGIQTGQFAEDSKCAFDMKDDNRWPGK